MNSFRCCAKIEQHQATIEQLLCNMKLNLDLSDFRYSHSEVDLLSKLDQFKGAWTAFGNLAPERLIHLQKVATIESIGSSTRIEGNSLSNAQIKELLGNIGKQSFASRDEQEVAGYANTLSLIYSSWEDMPLSENLIKQLHASLLRLSDRDVRHMGSYKTVENSVAAMKDGKVVGIVFKTATPFDTPFLMQQLVVWYNEETERRVYHPLLLISVFITAFLAIHPFQDGNGRLSRVLTTLLLLRSGFAYVPYSSIESVIEKSKAAYYLNLRQSQITMEEEHPNWHHFFDYFLSCLQIQMKVLESKVSQEHLLAGVPELSLSILKLLESGAPVGIAELEKALKVPRSTIRFHLKRLLEDKRIVSFGRASAVKYQIRNASF